MRMESMIGTKSLIGHTGVLLLASSLLVPGLFAQNATLTGDATPHAADAEGAARLVLDLHQPGGRWSPGGVFCDAALDALAVLGAEPAVVRRVLIRRVQMEDVDISTLEVLVRDRGSTAHASRPGTRATALSSSGDTGTSVCGVVIG